MLLAPLGRLRTSLAVFQIRSAVLACQLETTRGMLFGASSLCSQVP